MSAGLSGGSVLASGMVLGVAITAAVTLAPHLASVGEASCPVGQTLQGDTDVEGYDWFYCEPDVAPCEFEDSPGPCDWDATIRGNGLGKSFTVNADQTLTYRD